MLCRRLQPPFKPLLEENEKLVAQSSRQAPEALLPHEAGTQAQINNSNPGVPTRMESKCQRRKTRCKHLPFTEKQLELEISKEIYLLPSGRGT